MAGSIRYITRWTAAEDAALAKWFPGGGVAACRRALPHRTGAAIHMRVHNLGIRRTGKLARDAGPRPAYDHRALARALGVPEQPPGTPSGCSLRIVHGEAGV